MKKLSNKTKDKIYLTAFLIGIMWLIVLLFIAIVNLFAEEQQPVLTDTELINKYYTEQTIKNEIDYLAMWEYTENMSEEEYYNTFYKDELKEYEYVQQNFADKYCG